MGLSGSKCSEPSSFCEDGHTRLENNKCVVNSDRWIERDDDWQSTSAIGQCGRGTVLVEGSTCLPDLESVCGQGMKPDFQSGKCKLKDVGDIQTIQCGRGTVLVEGETCLPDLESVCGQGMKPDFQSGKCRLD